MTMLWEIVGSIAAVLTMFGFIPQITKIYKTRSVNDVSLPMLLQFSVGVFLWMLYGVHLQNYILIISNLISFLTLSVAIGLYFFYRSGKIEVEECELDVSEREKDYIF